MAKPKPRSQRMAVVLKLLSHHEMLAAREFEQYRQRMDNEQRQLVQLREYRQEYMAAGATVRGAIDMQAMQRQRHFLAHLSSTVEAQQSKLVGMEATLKQLKDVWLNIYQRREKMAELIKQYEKAESQAMDKLLQKELDELASQTHLLSSRYTIKPTTK